MPAKIFRVVTTATATVTLLGMLACSGEVPPEKRTFKDPQGHFSYVVPIGWVVWMGEARSTKGSLFSVESVNLQDSMPAFVEGLPETMVVLTKEQTQRFFNVVGKGVQKDITLNGLTVRQVTFPVRVREGDPESEVVFWIARHGDNVFVLRVSYPAGKKEFDEPGIQEILATWKFTPLPTPDPDTTTGKFVKAIPQ